jgi:hypothetical protein
VRHGPAALVLASAVAVAGAARGGEAPGPAGAGRLALEPLRASGVSPALAAVIEERICAALPEASGAEVVCPADVAAAAELARQAALFGECRTEECLERVDRVRAAERRVTATVERADGALVLSLRVAQAAAGAATAPGVTERLPEDLDALVSRIPAIVKKLFPR